MTETWTEKDEAALIQLGCDGTVDYQDCVGFTLARKKITSLESRLAAAEAALSEARADAEVLASTLLSSLPVIVDKRWVKEVRNALANHAKLVSAKDVEE